MRKTMVWILILLLLPFAMAEQRILVVENNRAYEWMDEIPDGYGDVIAKIAAQDASAAKAGIINFYPDEDGCWAFCRTKTGLRHEGSFWYVGGEQAYPLGSIKDIYNWDFFPGEGVFYCATGDIDHREVNVAIAGENGPVLLEAPEEITYLYGMGGGRFICGMRGAHNYDYAFLTVEGDRLVEMPAETLDPAGFNAIPGAQDFLMELTDYYPSVCSVSFLIRENGAITANVTHDDGRLVHGYLWSEADGLHWERGWENEIALLDGHGT